MLLEVEVEQLPSDSFLLEYAWWFRQPGDKRLLRALPPQLSQSLQMGLATSPGWRMASEPPSGPSRRGEPPSLWVPLAQQQRPLLLEPQASLAPMVRRRLIQSCPSVLRLLLQRLWAGEASLRLASV